MRKNETKDEVEEKRKKEKHEEEKRKLKQENLDKLNQKLTGG